MTDVQPLADRAVRRLARSSMIAFSTYGAGAVLTYISQLVIVRAVGVNSYGIYATVIAWMTMLAYLAALGFDVSLLRFIPTYRARHAWDLLRGVTVYAERCVFGVGLGIVAAGACVLVFWARPEAETMQASLAGLLLVPVWALLWVRAAQVRAFGGVVSALAPDRLVRDGLMVALIGVASLYQVLVIDARIAVLATLFASSTGLVVVTISARRRFPVVLSAIKPVYAGPLWRGAALPLVLIAVTEAAMNRTGVVTFGWMGFIKEAGIYALAFNITSLVLLPRMAVNALLAPMISEVFIRNDRPALQRLTRIAAIWTSLGSVVIAVPLFVLTKPLLTWFGPDFIVGGLALHILLAGQVLVSATGSQLFLLTMTGHERIAAMILICCAVANVALTILLIATLGLAGAAAASTAMLVTWNVAMAFFIWRKLDLLPSVLMICLQTASSACKGIGHLYLDVRARIDTQF